jgi:hypothetical protein
VRDQKTKIIACAVVVEELRAKLPPGAVCERLDFGLHRSPEVLKAKLQETIDQSTGYDTIVLAYGLCGMAVIGLHSESATLVVPKADDCITLLLGSRQAYLKQQKDNPGSLFLSKGWIEGRITDDSSPTPQAFQLMVEKYGEERAKRIQAAMFRHYHRMAFINTNNESNLDAYREEARQRAAHLNLRYEEITGSTAFMEKIANGLWDHEFVVVPPGRPVSFADFWPDASKAPVSLTA